MKRGLNEFYHLTRSQVPKYLPVASFSAYETEEELLFCGKTIIFRIHNIMERQQNNKEHLDELLCLNLFQGIIKNEAIKSANNKTWNLLISMIQIQKKKNMKYKQIECKENDDDDMKINDNLSEYGQALFHYFCNNEQAKSVKIKNFKSLPLKLKHVLFQNKNNNGLSLIPIIILFGSLEKITLTDLNIDSMVECDAALNLINYMQSIHVKFGTNLNQISFHSEREPIEVRQNNRLDRLCNEHHQKIKKLNCQWSVDYNTDDKRHNVIFKKQESNSIAKVLDVVETGNPVFNGKEQEIWNIIDSNMSKFNGLWEVIKDLDAKNKALKIMNKCKFIK